MLGVPAFILLLALPHEDLGGWRTEVVAITLLVGLLASTTGAILLFAAQTRRTPARLALDGQSGLMTFTDYGSGRKEILRPTQAVATKSETKMKDSGPYVLVIKSGWATSAYVTFDSYADLQSVSDFVRAA